LKGKLGDNFKNLVYLRIQTGDELGKRVKFWFTLISWK
jgi:hypothetical protein